jgi:hypothetical protein
MSLETIVNVTVTRDTRAPTQAGFGVPLLAFHHLAFPELAKAYGELSELTDEGFAATHPVYIAAQLLKAQNPTIEGFVVGRLATALKQTVNWTPSTLTEGFTHKLRIGATTYEYENGGAESVGTIVDGMAIAAAAAPDVTLSDETTHLEVEVDDAEDMFEFEAFDGSTIEDITLATNLATELAAIASYTETSASLSWYGLLIDKQSSARIVAAATFAESNLAQLLVNTADTEVLNPSVTDDVASTLQDASRVRTGGFYHHVMSSHAAAALMGLHLAYQPGIATMAHKALSGVLVSGLTSGEKAAINAKNFSHYTAVAGLGDFFEAKTPAGEYLDIVRDIDFSTARIKEAVFSVLANNPKVPYTDTGAELIRSTVHGVLRLCSSSDHPIFDPESIIVTVPKVADVATADRAARLLPSVRYEARLQGAIHRVRVVGYVTV